MIDHSVLPIVPLFGLFIVYLTANWPILSGWWLVLLRFETPGTPEQETGEEATPPTAQGQIAPATCPACEAAKCVPGPTTRHPEAPPRIEERLGRPPEVDTSSHFCPNPDCRDYGWVGLGDIRSNGHPNGSRWRQLECKVCYKTFMETVNTIFNRKQESAETIWRVLTSLAEGVGIRKTARIFDLDPNTVEKWLKEAAEHAEAVSHYLLHDLHLTQVQVDELWALLGKRSDAKRATCWVWLATVVGDRSQACAQLLIHAIVLLLAPGCIPRGAFYRRSPATSGAPTPPPC